MNVVWKVRDGKGVRLHLHDQALCWACNAETPRTAVMSCDEVQSVVTAVHSAV